ncbi:MAG TPA: IS1182 family transposase [Ktedonobacteraceae bacterium]
MKSHGLEPIPEETRLLVQRLIPKGTLVTKLRDALGPIYSDEAFAHLFPKRGRPAEAPWRLALVTVLQAIEGLTDRQAAEAVRTRIDWLYALALPLDDPGFDFTILTDFRQRVLSGQAQDLLLDPILYLCRERGWLKAHGKQRTDATAVLARVRALNSLESVGESMRATLNALAEQEPEWLQAHLNPAWFERYVHRFELTRFPKAETQRTLLREHVGQDVAQLLASLDDATTPESVRNDPSVVLLRQVFAQHYERQGEQIRWRDGPAVTNAERVVSPYDQQARSSRKRDTIWLGYKVHLTETCDQDPACPHLITHVETTVATRQDSELLALIQAQLRAKELAPAEHYVDQGYPSGPQLVQQAQMGTQIIGPVGQDPSWQQREHTGYAISDFPLDEQAQVATCPQGKPSVSWTQKQDRRQHPTVVIRFATATCRACAVREQWTHGQEGRTLTLTPPDVRTALLQRRAEQRTPAFVQQYALRAGVEGTISQALRTTRLRRTPYDGLPKTHLHHVAIAAGLNLKRIAAHLHALSLGNPSRLVRRTSPFARLQDKEAS